MSEIVERIRKDYQKIGQARSYSDAEKAYVSYYQTLEETRPGPRTLAQLPSRYDPIATNQVASVFDLGYARARDGEAASMFRGSGLLALGDAERIVAVTYLDHLGDPVADHYGNYQYRGLQKVGLGMMLAKSVIHLGYEEEYEEAERVHIENGLKPAELPPHHLGYFSGEMPSGLKIAAGASGVLPSETLRADLSEELRREIDEDWEKGLTDNWTGNELAGFYDMLASGLLLDMYRNVGLQSGERTAAGFAEAAKFLHALGQNLH